MRDLKGQEWQFSVEKEIPDAEEFVFTGNLECVSMSREVMRTAAITHTHAASLYIIWNILNTHFRLSLGSALRLFFIFGRNRCI